MKFSFLIVAFVTTLASSAMLSQQAPAADDKAGPGSDKLFKELDANGDGKLTESEIPKEHRKFFERLLRIGDSDKNGSLTRAEFDSALAQKEEPVTDINKTGGLGLGQPARGKANINPKRVFEVLDKNKDGKLTRDEAQNRPMAAALFDRLGKDELTLDDVTAAMKNEGGKGKAKGKGKKRTQPASTEGEKSAEAMPGGAGGHFPPAFFKLLDANHDGMLSKAEFAKVGEMFDQLDQNQDGFLEPRELMGHRSSSESVAEKTSAKTNPEGQSTTSNLRGRAKLMQMLKDADKDGDGKISLKEAPKQFKKNFTDIDKDGDGFIDQGEVRAWLQSRRKKSPELSEKPDSQVEKSKKTSGL